METLSSSTTQILFKLNRTNRGSSFSRNHVCLPNQSSTKMNLGLISRNHLWSTMNSCSQTDVSNTEVLTEDTYELNTVRVRFQLRKECLFGEQFLVVGNDPILGLWDPARGILLDWSDEHVWTVELDLPVGKSLQFKFILKRAEQDIFWQPGPDRILETWETKNTIVVSEDWENANIQQITEELSKEAITCSDIYLNIEEPMVNENTESIGTENIAYLKEETSANADVGTIITENKTDKEENPPVEPKEGSLVAENIFDIFDVITTDKKLGGTRDVDLVGCVGERVLVPGLIQLPDVDTEKGFFMKRESNSALDASSEIDENHGMPEPYENEQQEKQDVGILNEEVTSSAMIDNKPKEEEVDSELDEKIQLNVQYKRSDGQEAPREVWQNDFKWGRKTLNKLLTTLGFPLD